jgi:hypothetical protein
VAATLAALGAPVAGPAIQLTSAEPGAGTARLTGRVVPRGRAVAHYFEYGPTSDYGSATPTRSLAPEAGPTDVAETVAGTPGEPLHYRLVAADVDGVTLGPDRVIAPLAPADPIEPAPLVPDQPPGSVTGGAPPVKGADRPPAPARPSRVESGPARPRPKVAVRRSGKRWFLALRLGAPGDVAGRLERRRQHAGRSAFATSYARVLGLRRRGLPAGARRIPLGRLKAGAYRLTLDVRTGDGRVRIVKAFRVTARA